MGTGHFQSKYHSWKLLRKGKTNKERNCFHSLIKTGFGYNAVSNQGISIRNRLRLEKWCWVFILIFVKHFLSSRFWLKKNKNPTTQKSIFIRLYCFFPSTSSPFFSDNPLITWLCKFRLQTLMEEKRRLLSLVQFDLKWTKHRH